MLKARLLNDDWVRVKSSSFLVLAGEIIKFSRARGWGPRVFSRSRLRSSSCLLLAGEILEFSCGR